MTLKLIALQTRVVKFVERRSAVHDDRGQGALEYVGALVIAALIIVAVYAGVKGQVGAIGTAISTAVRQFLTGA